MFVFLSNLNKINWRNSSHCKQCLSTLEAFTFAYMIWAEVPAHGPATRQSSYDNGRIVVHLCKYTMVGKRTKSTHNISITLTTFGFPQTSTLVHQLYLYSNCYLLMLSSLREYEFFRLACYEVRILQCK